jgi:CRP/FNR family transcriptional regulator, cyclic AMP receptor protein
MDRVAVLSVSSLFDMLSNDELSAIAGLAREVQFPSGHVLFEEGELGDSVYVVVQGEVEVMVRDVVGNQQCIATLGPSQFFGEMSLIDKEYRSATVRAKTTCELLHFTSDDLTRFRKQHRDGFTLLVINIARRLSARLREANVRKAN